MLITERLAVCAEGGGEGWRGKSITMAGFRKCTIRKERDRQRCTMWAEKQRKRAGSVYYGDKEQ